MRNSLLAAVLLLGFIGVLPVSAAVIDQECQSNTGSVTGLMTYVEGQGAVPAVFGQEFVPSLSGLVGLDLMLVRINPDSGGIIEKADLEVSIHEDTIDGAIITQGIIEAIWPSKTWMHVDFSETTLDIGRTYVIKVYEPVMSTFAWVSGGDYEPGAAYFEGVLDLSVDMNFRTYAVPEPVTLSLLSVGALALLRRKK